MRQQRGVSRLALAGLGFFPGLWGLTAALPRDAAAVQIFIENAFVHRKNGNCVNDNVNGIPRFRCAPIPDTRCCGNANICGPAAGGCAAGLLLGNEVPSIGPCEPSVGPCPALGSWSAGIGFHLGNISNEPRIEFDREQDAFACAAALAGTGIGAAPFPAGTLFTNFCNASLFLCGAVGFGTGDTTAATSIDELSFEVFKFQDGSNPLDEGSTPPQRTFFVDAPGILPGATSSDVAGPLGPFCVLFDGFVNIQGEQGKTNGTYGFRVKTKTNQTGASGNIQITAVRGYPSGATRSADFAGVTCTADAHGCVVSQKPITMDVTNVHVVRSSPSLVGATTPVPVQPYNIFYRLSKDATMFISINDSSPPFSRVRTVLPGVARIGEGTPQGTLTNGDSWNGRHDNGDLMPPGVYLLTLQAFARDQFGPDLAEATTRQIALDPLQITDIRVSPLLEGATSLAVIDYLLSEPATTFIDIYPPNTQFCDFTRNVNFMAEQGEPLPPKDFQPRTSSCGGAAVAPIKRIVEHKSARLRVLNFWDGRDTAGTLVPDGNYIFAIYAALPSQNGFAFNGDPNDKRIWTSQVKSFFITVSRGFVGISQVTPASSVIGSSPGISGLNPFVFRYSLSRDGIVSMKIFDATGRRLVKTLITNEIRPGLFPNQERWDEPTDDFGLVVDSGSYMVQLTVADPTFPTKLSTTTALFSVNLFRITDIAVTPLLSGASDLVLLSYQLSQPMNLAWNIYPPGTIILNSSSTWPPCSALTPTPCAQVVSSNGVPLSPLITFSGLRAGRLRITEQWDGRDSNGLLVPDGQYVFTLVARSTTTPARFAIDKIFGTITVQRGAILFPAFSVQPDIPDLLNSSNTITLHPFTISYSLTRQSSVTIQILTTSVPPVLVRTVVNGQVRQNGILLQDVWDGRDERGNFPPSGFYTVRAVASDIASALSSGSTAQVTISHDPIRIYDVAVTPLRLDTGGSSIFYQVSESMKVAVKIFKPGTFFDVAGNPSPPESISLVKRIIGVRPARTAIEDIWDGTDLRLSLVPDGNYKFKIVGSTDIRAIDDISGNVLNPGALSLDRPIDEIPVVRNGSADPVGDFERNTFAFPNPVRGPKATFSIYLPFQAKVKLRLYNLAGELVLEKDFGEQAPSFAANPLSFDWNKTNQAGRGVARGLYYAVIRAEETLGGKNILQTVKKLLLP